ncbi:MAG TPA: hypothetical protein PKK20_10695 [Verrucomicrobiota bacterium]|nr:MAG: hypothetical protein BWX48_03222 [Verrucomicrobia bacterium ADurb.Bin006]HNV00396.1 hypothetical protein [Verrucomicrobiota bacterium]
MLSRDTIEAFAVIVASGGGVPVRARLANGHRFVVCATRSARRAVAGLAVGDRIRARFSPCDLSKGWYIVDSEGKQ